MVRRLCRLVNREPNRWWQWYLFEKMQHKPHYLYASFSYFWKHPWFWRHTSLLNYRHLTVLVGKCCDIKRRRLYVVLAYNLQGPVMRKPFSCQGNLWMVSPLMVLCAEKTSVTGGFPCYRWIPLWSMASPNWRASNKTGPSKISLILAQNGQVDITLRLHDGHVTSL